MSNSLPTIQNLLDLKRDADDAASIVNGGPLNEVITRYGGVKPSLAKAVNDALLRQVSKNPTGDWQAQTQYLVNDLWRHDGIWYLVLADYNSSMSAPTDIASNAVTTYSGGVLQSDLDILFDQIQETGVTPEMLGFDLTTEFGEFVSAVSVLGATGKGKAGKTYTINSPAIVTLSNDLSLDFSKSVLLQGGDNPVLALTNTATIISVSSLSKEAYNLGNSNVLTKVNKITAPGHTFEIGDLIKIFSDDIVPFSDANNQRCGEWFIVGAVDGDDIYTTGELVEAYINNIKLAKPSRAKLNLSLHIESILDDTINDSLLTIQGYIKPQLSVVARNANATCINITGCYKATAIGCRGNFAKNSPLLSSYGYFINDSASFMTQVIDMKSEYARHAYTTTTPSTQPNDDKWMLRGRTMFSQVINSVAQGCANAFDTHAPAYQIAFLDCITKDDFRGNDTGGAGFQIRGQRCKVRGESINSRFGAAVSGARATETQYVDIDITHIGPEGHKPVIVNGSANYGTLGTVVVRGTLRDSSAVLANHATLDFWTWLDCEQAINGSKIFDLGEGCHIRWKGGNLNYQKSAGLPLMLAEHTDPDSSLYCLQPITITNGNAHLLYAADINTYNLPSVYFLNTDFALNGTPFLAADNSDNASVFYTQNHYQRPLGYRAISYGAAGNRDLDLAYAGDPIIVVRFTTSADNVAVNTLTKGAFWGQLLVLCNRDASTHILAINNNSSGLIRIGATRNLTPSGSLILFWDGTAWRLASDNTLLTGFVVYNPPALASGEHDITTLTLSGAALGTPVQVAFEADLQGVDLTAYVSAPNTITIKFHNNTSSVINLNSATIRVRLQP